MIKYFKIWFDVIQKYISLELILKTLVEYMLYFIVFYIFITRSVSISLFVALTLIAIRLLIQIVYFYKKLILSNDYNLILLKPVDPLFGLLIYNRNAADILILLPILIFIHFKNSKLEKNISFSRLNK